MSGPDASWNHIIERRGRPADEAVLAQLEATLGIELPTAYRNFLARGDGARFREYNEIKGTWHSGVADIFAVADPAGSERPLAHVMNVYRDRVPPAFLPIADDMAGNLILIGVAPPHRGQIYFWDHEWEAEEDEPPTMDNMELIAGTFDELLDRITLLD